MVYTLARRRQSLRFIQLRRNRSMFPAELCNTAAVQTCWYEEQDKNKYISIYFGSLSTTTCKHLGLCHQTYISLVIQAFKRSGCRRPHDPAVNVGGECFNDCPGLGVRSIFHSYSSSSSVHHNFTYPQKLRLNESINDEASYISTMLLRYASPHHLCCASHKYADIAQSTDNTDTGKTSAAVFLPRSFRLPALAPSVSVESQTGKRQI